MNRLCGYRNTGLPSCEIITLLNSGGPILGLDAK